MRTIKLATIDGKIIYEAPHHSMAEAVESAIRQSIPMDRVDLSNTILRNINLDGIQIQNASFRGADLSGANMSEAHFENCDFSDSNMTDACLCYSNLNNCNLKYANFFATDIAMTSLVSCAFEGFSTFQLRFHSAFRMSSLTYHHFGKTYEFHQPPTLITSGENSFALLNNFIILKDCADQIDLSRITQNSLKDAIEKMQSAIVSA